MPVKAPVYEAPYSWTGFYIGINGGGEFGHSNWSNALGSNGFSPDGAVVGGTVGYNYQMGQSVFGLEGDVDWSDIRGTTTGGVCTGTSCETRNQWLATTRGRLGYAFGRFMPYVTGGAAFGDIEQFRRPVSAARPPRGPVGPSAAGLRHPSLGRGAPRSNISMSISARAIATPRLAGLRPARA